MTVNWFVEHCTEPYILQSYMCRNAVAHINKHQGYLKPDVTGTYLFLDMCGVLLVRLLLYVTVDDILVIYVTIQICRHIDSKLKVNHRRMLYTSVETIYLFSCLKNNPILKPSCFQFKDFWDDIWSVLKVIHISPNETSAPYVITLSCP